MPLAHFNSVRFFGIFESEYIFESAVVGHLIFLSPLERGKFSNQVFKKLTKIRPLIKFFSELVALKRTTMSFQNWESHFKFLWYTILEVFHINEYCSGSLTVYAVILDVENTSLKRVRILKRLLLSFAEANSSFFWLSVACLSSIV